MTTLLRLDASARQTRSLSRSLGDRFISHWHAHRPEDEVIHRDVGQFPPPAVSEEWIAAAFTPAEERTPEQAHRLALSDSFIAELSRAEFLVVATPMYNYGMPAALKAWVDQVIRIGKTFSFDLGRGDFPLEPILSGKTMVMLTASGEFGFEPGGLRAGMDHLTTHLRTVSHYLGVENHYHVGIEYQEFCDERYARSVYEAENQVAELASMLTRQLNGDTIEFETVD